MNPYATATAVTLLTTLVGQPLPWTLLAVVLVVVHGMLREASA